MKSTEVKVSRYQTKVGYKPSKGYERTRGTSMTIPDDSFTVRELMHRFTNGMRIPDAKAALYEDGDLDSYDLEKLSRLSRPEQDEVIEELKEKAERQKNLLRSMKKKEDKPPEPQPKKE